jgi:hypothetical protein
VSFTSQIITDDVTPRLRALTRHLAPGRGQALLGVLGKTVEVELRAWFAAANEGKANRRGWKRQNFWSQMRTRTAYDPALTTPTTATVVIADPRLAPHVYGGTIRPKESKYLAIPLRPEAYGVRPKSGLIAGLRFAPIGQTSNTVGYLVRREGKGPDAPVVSYYRLVRKVTIRPDPSALPPARLTSEALVRAATAFVARNFNDNPDEGGSS